LLITTNRFLPLFITQFLGAFNDNVYKNALIILLIFQGDSVSGIAVEQLATLSAGVFILPYFLFSATAGQLADKYEKAKLIRYIKLLEIIIMSLAVLALHTMQIWYLISLLFFMGLQSTLFGPVKYAILPQHLSSQELISGNAIMSMGVFLAILLGTILGGILIAIHDYGQSLVASVLLVVAIAGYISSSYIPVAAPPEANLRLNWNIFTQTWRIFKFALSSKSVFIAIIAAAWFWLLGATFLSQIPAYAKNILGSNNEVVTILLFMFSLGIGLGSLMCTPLSKIGLELRLVPIAAIGIIIFSIDLYLVSNIISNLNLAVGGFALYEFMQINSSYRVLADVLLIGFCGGLYIVPLNTLIQRRSNPLFRARVIAAANIVNAAFMVLSAVAIMLCLKFGFSIAQIFLMQAMVSIIVFALIFYLMPEFIFTRR
jgi:MFS family permease